MSTGNEIVKPGETRTPSQIFDVNQFTLSAVVAAHGGSPESHDAAPDTLDDLQDALDRCADADIIVFSGGSSVGERDLIVDLVRQRGQMIFHGIAVKPGKPTAFARVGDAAFFGMPGNPTSCLSNAYILLVPFLRATARLPLAAPRIVQRAAGQANRLAGRSPSVLHGADRERRRDAGVQRIRRHHQHVAGGRLYRDSRRPEHGRGGDDARRYILLGQVGRVSRLAGPGGRWAYRAAYPAYQAHLAYAP